MSGLEKRKKQMNKAMFLIIICLLPIFLFCEESNIEDKLWGVWNLREEWDQNDYTWERRSPMGSFYIASANSYFYEFINLDMVMLVGGGEGMYPIVSFTSKGDTVYLEVTRQVSNYDETGKWVELIGTGIVAVHFINDNEIWLETIKEKSNPWFPLMFLGKREHIYLRARKVIKP